MNGKPTITKGDGGWGMAPRTAIGQKEDGTVLMLVINGYSKESIGATLFSVQEILLSNGAVTAAILDGGDSSTMYFNNNIVNKPANFSGEQRERTVPSIFMVLP